MDRRDEFLRTWYQVLWSNIDRSMTSIWQIAGPIGLVGAVFVYIDRLGPHLAVCLQLVIGFWALNNTIDMNSWHRRNLIFVFRVERQFLHDRDYGVVIPSSFREPRTDWIQFYTINFVTFLVMIAMVIAVYLVKMFRIPPATPCVLVGPAVVLLAGIIATAYTHRRCERRIATYLRETGENPSV